MYTTTQKFLHTFICSGLLLFTSMTADAQSVSGQSDINESRDPETSQTQRNQVQENDEISTDAEAVARGRQLFGQHCTACHQVGQQVIGPALASVHQRRPLPWLIKFIKNSQNVILNEDDEYAKQLYEQYNQVVMPAFEFLSDGDIVNIMSYIKAESSSATGYGGVNGADGGSALDGSNASGAAAGTNTGVEPYEQKPGDNQTDVDGGTIRSESGNAAEGDETDSGLSTGATLGIGAGMLVLIGLIFAFAKRSGSSKKD